MSRELRRLSIGFALAWPLYGGWASTVWAFLLGDNLTLYVWIQHVAAWCVLSLLTPLVIYAVDRIRFVRGRRIRAAAAHVALALGMLIAHAAIFAWYGKLVIEPRWNAAQMTVFNLVVFARYDAINYGLLVIAVKVTRQRRLARRSELVKARLESRLARAELDRVRHGIDPDYVIRSLQELDDVIARDSAAAESRLHELCRFLREKLQHIRTSPVRTARPPALPRPIGVRATVVLIGVGFGVYAAALDYALDLMRGQPNLIQSLALTAAWAAAGLITTLFVPLLRRCTATSEGLARQSGYLAIAVAIAMFESFALAGLFDALRPLGFGLSAGVTFSTTFLLCLLCTWFVYFDELERRQRRTSVETEVLTGMLAVGRLRSLRTQLAPHFLFNTLNSVMSQLRLHPDGARNMLHKLSQLLRTTAADTNRQLVSLREDLEVTANYIDIERVRFRDALEIRTDVDESLLDAAVPAFLLQPLVENAVQHGALASIGRGTVRVAIARDDDRITIRVENDGELIDPSRWREGVGLTNLRARLAQIYGDRHRLDIAVSDGGVSIRMSFPVGDGVTRTPAPGSVDTLD